MQLEYSNLNTEKVPVAGAVRRQIEKAIKNYQFYDMEVHSVSVGCRFVIDRLDEMAGYRLRSDIDWFSPAGHADVRLTAVDRIL